MSTSGTPHEPRRGFIIDGSKPGSLVVSSDEKKDSPDNPLYDPEADLLKRVHAALAHKPLVDSLLTHFKHFIEIVAQPGMPGELRAKANEALILHNGLCSEINEILSALTPPAEMGAESRLKASESGKKGAEDARKAKEGRNKEIRKEAEQLRLDNPAKSAHWIHIQLGRRFELTARHIARIVNTSQ
jgi:hypothetical protein